MSTVKIPLEDLLKKADSRYKLTLVAAQRANELITGAPALVEVKSRKPGIVSLEEIAAGKVRYEEAKPTKSKKSEKSEKSEK